MTSLMLTNLIIKNFAIIKYSNIDLSKGMTSITGETGAGKSIFLDAINIVLGARIDSSTIQNDKRCELIATFDLKNILNAKNILKKEMLINEVNPDECSIHRIIEKNGKNKTYINNRKTTAKQVKIIAESLITIYAQHAHHNIFDNNFQLELLDLYSGTRSQTETVSKLHAEVMQLEKNIASEKQAKQNAINKRELLEYQYEELSQLNLEINEFHDLDESQKQLACNSESLITFEKLREALGDGDVAIISEIDKLLTIVKKDKNKSLNEIYEMLSQSKIYLDEALENAKLSISNIEHDPEEINKTENRLSEIYNVARKHNTDPMNLYNYISKIKNELDALDESSTKIENLINQKNHMLEKYLKEAQILSKKRKLSSKNFSIEIEEYLHKLNIPKGVFAIELEKSPTQTSSGIDKCQFLMSFNTGQPLLPIKKVASGGELSRIGLTIQVICSKQVSQPTIFFDEVDVGISGSTASVVGELLRKISTNTQILCVTHQAQVAVYGDQQLHIYKEHQANETISNITKLSENERVNEIARIIGGVEITPQATAYAKEMFLSVHKK